MKKKKRRNELKINRKKKTNQFKQRNTSILEANTIGEVK